MTIMMIKADNFIKHSKHDYYVDVVVKPVSNKHCIIHNIVMSQQRCFWFASCTLQRQIWHQSTEQQHRHHQWDF